MAKIKTVGTIGEFMKGEQKRTVNQAFKVAITAAGPAMFLLSPAKILADTAPAAVVVVAPENISAETTFNDIYNAVMAIFDAGVVLVIVFAGAAWGLGHRTKAIEIVIGVCCGYLLARNAVEIRDFLKSIGN